MDSISHRYRRIWRRLRLRARTSPAGLRGGPNLRPTVGPRRRRPRSCRPTAPGTDTTHWTTTGRIILLRKPDFRDRRSPSRLRSTARRGRRSSSCGGDSNPCRPRCRRCVDCWGSRIEPRSRGETGCPRDKKNFFKSVQEFFSKNPITDKKWQPRIFSSRILKKI